MDNIDEFTKGTGIDDKALIRATVAVLAALAKESSLWTSQRILSRHSTSVRHKPRRLRSASRLQLNRRDLPNS
jgi:hypothetical protein